jgi:raffinose/stachyose/melibiose transport system permease protein
MMHLSTNRLFNAVVGVVLLLAALIQLVPFYVAVTTAFKPVTDLSSQLVPPHELFFGNFLTALNQGNILRAVGNSILITVISTVLVCLLGAMAAYPLARRLTAVNKTVALVIVGLIMVPPLSILVPLYTMMNQLHAINSYWGVIAVMVTGHLPLAIFLYTAFMRSLPLSIEEAATVDGANMLQILFRIIFPVLKPVTATVIILSGVSIWNEFSLSGYLLAKPSVQTIAPAIGSFFSQQSSNLGAAAAASLIAVIPVLVAYLFLQKYFIKGMVAGAEK